MMRLRRWTASFAAAGLLVLSACASAWSRAETFVMNTVLVQQVDGPEAVCEDNERIARDLENLLSRTLQTSEIYQVSHADGPVQVSAETKEVLEASLDAWEDTGGAFDPALGALRDAWGFGTDDPSVPDPEEIRDLLSGSGAGDIEILDGSVSSGGADIDLGGAAKGFALDEMRESMEEDGVENALISFGGAILAMGHRKDGADWKIGIRDPFADDASKYIGMFGLSDALVETSGVSEQGFTENGTLYHHLLDPKTGMPADNSLVSVTVVSQSGMEADILSTALFVMGPEDGMEYAKEHSIAALFITEDRAIWKTPAMRCEIEDLDPAFRLV